MGIQVSSEALLMVLEKGFKKVKKNEKSVSIKIRVCKNRSTMTLLHWQGFTLGQKIEFSDIGTTRKKCKGNQTTASNNDSVQKCSHQNPKDPGLNTVFCCL